MQNIKQKKNSNAEM